MTEKLKNISGVFPVDLNGQMRDTRMTLGVIESLERHIWKKPIAQVLSDATEGRVFCMDIIDALHIGLAGNKDTRLSREDLAEIMIAAGTARFIPWFIEFLSYALGGDDAEALNPIDATLKKK